MKITVHNPFSLSTVPLLKFRLLLVLLYVCLSTNIYAQNITAWNDFNNRFRIFDNGEFRQLESMAVEKFTVGYDWVAYISNNNTLKYYRHGKTSEITEGAFVQTMSDRTALFYFTQTRQLDVIENNKRKTLTTWLETKLESDSLVFYKDGYTSQYFVYGNGTTYTLDDISPLEKNFEKLFSLGKNTFAYINSSQRLRVLYANEFYGLDDAGSLTSFGAGQNIVAYTDRDGLNFTAFWKGNIYPIDANAPAKFSVANDMVAYVDVAGTFKVWDSGETITLDSYEPATYEAIDSVIAFESSIGQFKAYYNGKVYTLDNKVPGKYEVANGHIAWLDNNNWLQLFHKGKVINITKEEVTNVVLDGNLLRFTAGVNDTKVWWNGVIY